MKLTMGEFLPIVLYELGQTSGGKGKRPKPMHSSRIMG